MNRLVCAGLLLIAAACSASRDDAPLGEDLWIACGLINAESDGGLPVTVGLRLRGDDVVDGFLAYHLSPLPSVATWGIEPGSISNGESGATFESQTGVVGKSLSIEWSLRWVGDGTFPRLAVLTSNWGTKIVHAVGDEELQFLRPLVRDRQ